MSHVPEFMIARRFAAPIEKVFDAWADQDKMIQWSGPAGAKVEILEGEVAEGERMISRTYGEPYPDMYALSYWREIRPHTRIAWEQSFCDREGNKILPPFFENWPSTLLTAVDFADVDGETEVTLRWIPIEYDEAGLAEFAKQMASMTQGWGGSFDKLEDYLASD